jgi:hypothetical protein
MSNSHVQIKGENTLENHEQILHTPSNSQIKIPHAQQE